LPLADTENRSEPVGAASGLGNRRDFLKAAGFTFAGTLLSGCHRAPEQEAIPPLIQIADVVPGRSTYYASTCGACSAGCGLLVKSLDGRPIKLEGNPDHPASKGGLCAGGQASLLGLYDALRLEHPTKNGQPTTWSEIDRDIHTQLENIKRQGGAVRVLTSTITSPTTRAILERLLKAFPDARHVTYDALSCSAILDAHERTHGIRVLPRYRFERAEAIVSFDADFLGTWISPVEFTGGYRQRRLPKGKTPHLSHHVQIESRLSLTGSKADKRLCVGPDEIEAVMASLAHRLSRKAGVFLQANEWGAVQDGLSTSLADFCESLTKRLWQARGRSLVLCGSQDVSSQLTCNFINHLLDSYGSTIDIDRPSLQRQGSDRELEALLRELATRKVAALLLLDCNPVYDLPDENLAEALHQVPLLVCCSERLDETARVAGYVCPQPHYLESWEDVESVSGLVGIRQPTLPRRGNTRPILESLGAWSGSPKPAYDLLREYWKANVYPRQTEERSFETFWDRTVHNGYAQVTPVRLQPKPFDMAAVRPAHRSAPPADDSLYLLLYPKVSMRDGRHAYNPWLQELPDPLTKVTWDNYACLSPTTAARLGVTEGDVVSLEVGDRATQVHLPIFIQPGQHDRAIAVALGYGSMASERFAKVGPPWLEARPTVGENGLVGQNVAPLLKWGDGTLRYARGDVRVSRTGAKHSLASTQGHHSLSVPAHLASAGSERRPIVQETPLSALADRVAEESRDQKHAGMWPADHPTSEHRWGMVIDLNACTGCSACVIACQAENNIPVVGKDEVSRHREMHWLRIDRYYSEKGDETQVAFQPMLCQHCEKAPCETVCPVLATVHSEEGLNEQVYNRCVGTRYCANNCPYKVRRFNWFAYAHDDHLQNLALNPDVTVRSRGVMEKCTFCVQRIQDVRLEARRRGEVLREGDVQTACQQSCPAQAIVFGDLNDRRSQVVQQRQDPRHYHVLEELNIGPSVGYLKIIRDRQAEPGEKSHG
jgi:molybdopterin-containing oxidoreductase family iron-sulfur binding subunit